MKKLQLLLSSATLLFLGACSSTYHAGNDSADDVYYSSKDYSKPKATTYPATAPAPASEYSQNNNNTSTEPSNDQNNYSNSNDQNGSYAGDQRSQDYSNSTQTQDGQGNTYITNNYYNDDDYYD